MSKKRKRRQQPPQDIEVEDGTEGGGWISARTSSGMTSTGIRAAADSGHPMLSPGQRRVLELAVLQRKNVFFTGAAGSGKSFVLKRVLVDIEREHRLFGRVYCVAPTGLAAWNLGGTTIHSFAGVRDSDASLDDMIDAIYENDQAVFRWQHCQVLVWDEISMIDCFFLEKLDQIARTIRGRYDLPFGGIQLVVCGDFFQLPPVQLGRLGSSDPCWAFTSHLWKDMFDVHIMLKASHRQQQHSEFLYLLNQIRTGRNCDDTVKQLIRLSNQVRDSKNLDTTAGTGLASSSTSSTSSFTYSLSKNPKMSKYTKLFSTNKEVDAENKRCLDLLGPAAGPRVKFIAKDKSMLNSNTTKKKCGVGIMPDCPAQKKVVLRLGAQVILLKNVDQNCGLVNGCRGVVKGFTKDGSQLPIVEFYVGRKYPGSSITSSLSSSSTSSQRQPVITRTVRRTTWESKSGSTVLASREQIPLRLAYALTVHKCQGQTLPSAHVSFKTSAFTSGQAYVALSRTERVEDLDIGKLRTSDIRVSEDVVQFYMELFGTVA